MREQGVGRHGQELVAGVGAGGSVRVVCLNPGESPKDDGMVCGCGRGRNSARTTRCLLCERRVR